MVNDPDYRLYLEEKFKGITTLVNGQFETVHDKLQSIETQVYKTNGTVQEHERFKQYAQKIIDTRATECPQVDDINRIEREVRQISDDLSEYRMLKKYPKLGILIITIFVVGMYLGYRKIVNAQNDLRETVNMINTPVRTRSGSIEFWPSGVVIDSLHKNNTNIDVQETKEPNPTN